MPTTEWSSVYTQTTPEARHDAILSAYYIPTRKSFCPDPETISAQRKYRSPIAKGISTMFATGREGSLAGALSTYVREYLNVSDPDVSERKVKTAIAYIKKAMPSGGKVSTDVSDRILTVLKAMI